jgi:hypothetical protein
MLATIIEGLLPKNYYTQSMLASQIDQRVFQVYSYVQYFCAVYHPITNAFFFFRKKAIVIFVLLTRH